MPGLNGIAMAEFTMEKSLITPIIITGMSHSGKSLPAGLLSVYYKKIERVKEFKFGHILLLRRYGKISDDLATYLINNWLLQSWHDHSVGRNYNLRRDDETSIWNSLDRHFQFKKRMSSKREVPTSENYILIEPHNAILDYDFLKKINSKMIFINICRSPVETLYAWVRDSHYSDLILHSPYSQIITLNIKGKRVPLVAAEFWEEFVVSNPPDRCFLIYENLYLKEESKSQGCTTENGIISLRFEELLVDPGRFFSLTNEYFGTPEIRHLQKVMETECVPREIPSNQNKDKFKELKLRISPKFHFRLDQLVHSYEQIVGQN